MEVIEEDIEDQQHEEVEEQNEDIVVEVYMYLRPLDGGFVSHSLKDHP